MSSVRAGEETEIAIGSRVMGVTMFTEGHGSFADECVMRAEHAFPVPASLSDAEAAGFWMRT